MQETLNDIPSHLKDREPSSMVRTGAELDVARIVDRILNVAEALGHKR